MIKFGFELPADQKNLKCLRSVFMKTALLRDLCRRMGVQLLQRESKSGFMLGNDMKDLKTFFNSQ